MESKEQHFNLVQLTAEYRYKGRARKGYKQLKSLLESNSKQRLLHLLRDHEGERIELDEEIEFRDNVDFLLKFYSILEIAILTGYVHPNLNKELIKEINLVLTNSAVERYYRKIYPILLPEVLLKTNHSPDSIFRKWNQSGFNAKKFDAFSSFLLVIKTIENDDEVEQYQWFLDSGSTNGRNINDFNEIFSNKQTLAKFFMRKGGDRVLTAAFFGYIKYISFLTAYRELLDYLKDEPLLQSAIWHYQSYWFKQIRAKMAGLVTNSLIKLNKVINEVDNTQMITSGLSHEEIIEWKTESINILDKSIDDITRLIESKNYEKPLFDYLKHFR